MKNLITILFLLPLLIFGQYPVTDKQMVFQEQFTSEYDLIKNGGTSTDITYAYGQATYNGTTSKANYNLNLNGVYSVRIRCNPTSFTATRYLFDARGTNDDGVGRVRLASSTGFIVTTSGTTYVNGAATTSTTAGVNNEIVITGITLSQGTGANKTLIGSEKGGVSEFLGTFDLVEIYEGTLTPSQVENMFLGRTLIPFPQQVNEQSLQLLSKVESSQGVIYDVMGNTIVNTNVETIDIGQTSVQGYNGYNSQLNLGATIADAIDKTVITWFYQVHSGEFGWSRIMSNGKFELLCDNLSDTQLTTSLIVTSDGTGTEKYSAANSITYSEWNYVATTITSAGITNIYVGDLDNAPTLSGTANETSGTPNTGTTNLIIGNRDAGDRTVYGGIYEPQVYSGLMTLQQITNIWSESKQYLK